MADPSMNARVWMWMRECDRLQTAWRKVPSAHPGMRYNKERGWRKYWMYGNDQVDHPD